MGRSVGRPTFWALGAAILFACLPATAGFAQEEYGVILRTTDSVGGMTDRIRVQSDIGLGRVLLVNSYLDAGAQPIRNVAAPALATDAATKAYVDAAVSGAVGAVVLNGFAHVANAAGAVQFSAVGEDLLRFSAGSGLAVSFNAVAHEVAFAIPAGAIADSHLAGAISPSKIAGTALTQATAFVAAGTSDATVTGTFGSLDIQLSAGSVTNAHIAGTISASKVEDVWVNAAGDAMAGQLAANAGVAIPTGQQLRYRDAGDAAWALSTVSTPGALYVDLTGASSGAETRAWRLRDMAGATPTTRFSVNMLSGAVSVTGPLSMNANVISGLGAPVAGSDAATKAYVDAAVSGGGGIASINGQNGPAVTIAASPGSGLAVSAGGNGITLASDFLNPTTPNDYVHWNVLAGIPAGFADDVDNNTTYSAGAGLSLSGTTFGAVFGVTAGTVAEGNHAHDAAYVKKAGDTMTGPLGIGQTPAPDQTLLVVGSKGAIIVR